MKIFPIACALGALLVSACSSNPVKTSSPAAAPSDPRAAILSSEEAAIRAHQIAHTGYSLWFGLDAVNETYEGRAVVNFELKAKAKDHSKKLFIDFEEGTVRSLTVNGTAITPIPYDGHRITFSVKDLVSGTNRVEIAFMHPYGKDGNGLHRFKDPVDGQVYLYSNFEPYSAHKMFPCFDQPDLKASYELTVEAPQDWQIISNTLERDVSNVDGRKSWAFPPSPAFSTYVFALHAGPFAMWKSNADGIPIRLFARKSLKQYVDAPEWFEITKAGLEYYGVQFGYPYPYSKYDQILVPDFNAGAMENVGAVTFSERMVYRTTVTQDAHRGRADVILHEMAHMWFGDLVTMRWWNGLWLNESFATFMASKAVDESTRFKGAWQAFFNGMKRGAYWEDQSVVTHPIDVPVLDTDSAMANFDGITYGKGASALRQLAFYLGDENFREGVQRYFQKYALKNTTLHDFMKMLGEASGKDLAKWQKLWFLTSGTNTLQAKWACENGKVSQFSLLQGPGDENPSPLRPHRTRVGLYRAQGAALKVSDTADVSYSEAETAVPELIGKRCPDFVYPNHEDYDYVKVSLDSKSLETAQQSLSRIQDPFARQMIWATLWQMVIDARLKAQDYAELVLKHGLKETDTQVLSSLIRSLLKNSLETSAGKFLPNADRFALRDRIEPLYLKKLQAAAPGSDLQLIWYSAFVNVAHTPMALDYLNKLLTGKAKLRGFPIDQERRWGIIQALARMGHDGVDKLISAEREKDKTDMGERHAIEAEASIPTIDNKKEWLGKVLAALDIPPAAGTLSVSKLRHALWFFHDIDHEDLSRVVVEPYFTSLSRLSNPALSEFARSFAGLYPNVCDPLLAERAGNYLKDHPELPATVVKSLKIYRQEDERCVKARALAEAKH